MHKSPSTTKRRLSCEPLKTRLCLSAVSFFPHDLGAERGSVKSAVDIDGDSDVDILLADDSTIAWYENTDGQGTFGSQIMITDDAYGRAVLYAADVDGDGNLDVLSGKAWYENRLPGDANGDHSFDQRDLVQVMISAKYGTGLAADYSEGDWNGDGFFDQLDLVLALQAGEWLTDPAANLAADAIV